MHGPLNVKNVEQFVIGLVLTKPLLEEEENIGQFPDSLKFTYYSLVQCLYQCS